ncbi:MULTISPECIES: primosomal replication protein [unclassified Symbiopectobacterium]|uniref:primosomal replication protein n=1 Tax=unclassified Symbiopectobacterium TaxID=2794573 RepID=UPI002227C62D|nr:MULTISPECIES: primosomal replication protein [unclassified Symbiopectobacterium]MCW2474733.1 primosomal replication protein [Candidatus Symbiopectobacterium sp. NZEC151]MCW2487539.1 primosomal replication protein [Candidatus Symbiopectobacterium sp. NZEC127]
MNRHHFLQALEHQLVLLAQAVAPLADRPLAYSRFDRQLFQSHGTRLRDYLSEVEQNFQSLRHLVTENRTERVAFMTEKLVAQIGALQRELSTQALRRQEKTPVAIASDLYQKLAEHQDYERRLNLMIQDRESQLDRATTLSAQQQLQREVAALEGRLARCRQALARLERQVERREQGL